MHFYEIYSFSLLHSEYKKAKKYLKLSMAVPLSTKLSIDWIELVQCRDQWRIILKLPIP
jgi:hypothetical protein